MASKLKISWEPSNIGYACKWQYRSKRGCFGHIRQGGDGSHWAQSNAFEEFKGGFTSKRDAQSWVESNGVLPEEVLNHMREQDEKKAAKIG